MKALKPSVQIESTHLSTGQLMEITKFNRKYSFMLASTELLVAPELVIGITKSEAYKLYTDILKADVLDLDF